MSIQTCLAEKQLLRTLQDMSHVASSFNYLFLSNPPPHRLHALPPFLCTADPTHPILHPTSLEINARQIYSILALCPKLILSPFFRAFLCQRVQQHFSTQQTTHSNTSCKTEPSDKHGCPATNTVLTNRHCQDWSLVGRQRKKINRHLLRLQVLLFTAPPSPCVAPGPQHTIVANKKKKIKVECKH